MPVDILAFGAHPDDAELNCSGLLLKAKKEGASIGVVDLTEGELSSRGTPHIRKSETQAATEKLGLDLRVNLNMPDGRIERSLKNRDKIVDILRAHRPRLVIAPHWEDHHPDHRACSDILHEAWYMAGIGKYPGVGSPHRGESILYYVDRTQATPSTVVDISMQWEQKLQVISCYASQLHNPNSKDRATILSESDFLQRLEARHVYFGALIGVRYGEAFVMRQPVPLDNPLSLLWGRRGVV